MLGPSGWTTRRVIFCRSGSRTRCLAPARLGEGHRPSSGRDRATREHPRVQATSGSTSRHPTSPALGTDVARQVPDRLQRVPLGAALGTAVRRLSGCGDVDRHDQPQGSGSGTSILEKAFTPAFDRIHAGAQERRPESIDLRGINRSSQVRARFGSAPLSASRQERRSGRPQVERGELAHVRVRRKRQLPPFDHLAAQAPTAALATAPRGRGFLPARVP